MFEAKRQKNPEIWQSCGPVFKALEVTFLNLYVTVFKHRAWGFVHYDKL